MNSPPVSSAEAQAAVGFAPIEVLALDIGKPLEDLPRRASRSGAPYGGVLVLASLHGQPVGLVELGFGSRDSIAADELAGAIWREAGPRISSHLLEDGLPAVSALGPEGLPAQAPRCERDREAFLAEAPFVTVIVPSRDRPDRLRTALDSIIACDYPDERYEILVVDNAPATTGTKDLVENEFAAGAVAVRYAREDKPGSASARNTGVRQTEAELVAFTDDDVRADRHWLTELARGFTLEPAAAAVSGLVIPMELETAPQLWFEEYGGFHHGFDRSVYDMAENRPADDPLYPYAAGRFGTANNLAFRRSALLELGGFDPALGNGTPALGGVDIEMLLRTVLSGRRVVYQPSAVIHHLNRPDYESLRKQIYAYGAGMSAVMIKTLGSDPRLLPDFVLRRLPRGLWFALSPRSSKNEQKRSGYPQELTRLELRGLVEGPVLYARSRRRYGPHVIPRHSR